MKKEKSRNETGGKLGILLKGVKHPSYGFNGELLRKGNQAPEKFEPLRWEGRKGGM